MGRGPHRARGTTGSGLGTFNRQIKLRRPVPAVTCRSRVDFLRRVAWPERMGMCRATRGDRRDSPCVLELSFQNLAENAHGLVLEICPLFFPPSSLFHHLPGLPWDRPGTYISRGRLRNLGPRLHPKQ